MNIEPNAEPRRDRKDTVELPLRVTVNLQRIDAADQIGAVANRRVKQVGTPGQRITPLCANATICTVTLWRPGARAAS